MLLVLQMLIGFACLTWPSASTAQEGLTQSVEPLRQTVSSNEELSRAAVKVDVKPLARDEEIGQRLQNVLNATGWFVAPKVRVEEGVVFLSGQVATDELKKWAGDLARNTQDVVAVANRMEVPGPVAWDFRPAWAGMMNLWRDLVLTLPFLVFGLFTLALSVLAGVLAARAAKLSTFG
jgi:small conductance mechanosensitive channel